MILAYDRHYLEKAQIALATMFDYAVRDLGLDLDFFAGLFLASGYADRFGHGDVSLVVGRSGVELADEIVELTGGVVKPVKPRFLHDSRSEEYWSGWALAYYQWQTARSFREIFATIQPSHIRALYSPYHEMDLTQFVDRMDELTRPKTNRLKRFRLAAGLTQSELAVRSGVPLRTLQHYEQGSKDLRHASGETLLALARVVGAELENLLQG